MCTKQAFAIVMALFIFTSSSIAQDEDIKQVAAKETDTYFKKDSAGWASCWLQEPSTSQTFVSAFGYFNTSGWDSIIAQASRNFRNNPKPTSIQVMSDSFKIRKDGKIAVLDYKQTITFVNSQPPFDKFTSWEHRILVKKNGQWKIATQLTTNTSAYQDPAGELSLNAAGYGFLFSGKTEEAIQILELNAKFFPNSFNVFDSLGEAYAKAGKKELAIQNYEKSIQINPKNESGIKALKGLKE